MTICVCGLWHLGCVTAACIAERYETAGLDPNPETIRALNEGSPPVFEPGLHELIEAGIGTGKLRFTSSPAEALRSAEIVWVTFDTPVDDNDEADFGYVESQIANLFPYLRDHAIVLISSQMPAGSTKRIAAAYRSAHPEGTARFAYSPENLRLGNALNAFRKAERIVVGARSEEDRARLTEFLSPFCQNLVWMSVESAEMTKHALNAFLANSITFANEVAVLCEHTGADAKQVEQGLKSDIRIGPRAYVGPGGAFAGGTLARDVAFLNRIAERSGVAVPVLSAVRQSNENHKSWPRRKLEALLGRLAGKRIAVLGLTYKPGTDTLRRSAAIELCQWLLSENAAVCAFDPMVKALPEDLASRVTLCESAIDALKDADAAVIATEWPVFRELRATEVISAMKTPIVLDANRFLEASLGVAAPLQYSAVGKPREDA